MMFKEGKIRSQNGVKQRDSIPNRPSPPEPINKESKQ